MVSNIRELTKKEKIKGLTRTSWYVSLAIGGTSYPSLIFWSIPVVIFFICFFYILEFYDDDIIDIITTKLRLKAENEYFA